jgi:hypothetical protein
MRLPLYQSEMPCGSGKFALQWRGTWEMLGRGILQVQCSAYFA